MTWPSCDCFFVAKVQEVPWYFLKNQQYDQHALLYTKMVGIEPARNPQIWTKGGSSTTTSKSTRKHDKNNKKTKINTKKTMIWIIIMIIVVYKLIKREDQKYKDIKNIVK